MRPTLLLPSFFALLPLATANFDVYYVLSIFNCGFGQCPVIRDVFYIFDSDPDCAEVTKNPGWGSEDDVSGNKVGVRCKGRGCWDAADPSGVDLMEMHFTNNPIFHWTIYKDRDPKYQLFGLDGNVYGDCMLFPGNTFSCEYASGFGQWNGHRKFRCLTRYTATEINEARLKE